jgi:hypothetical protein
MEKIMKLRTLISATMFAAVAMSQSALAAELCTDVTARKTVDEAKAAAVAAGYVDITKMDEEDGCYEAKGLNADGSKFEVYIHPTTLEIVKVKKED